MDYFIIDLYPVGHLSSYPSSSIHRLCRRFTELAQHHRLEDFKQHYQSRIDFMEFALDTPIKATDYAFERRERFSRSFRRKNIHCGCFQSGPLVGDISPC